jgi:hypothetical protein
VEIIAMAEPISIRRKQDLVRARRIAAAIGQKRQVPVSDAFVELVADELGRFRQERHECMARHRREFAAELAQIRAEFNSEMDRYRAIQTALNACTRARKALNEALAMPHKALKEHAPEGVK